MCEKPLIDGGVLFNDIVGIQDVAIALTGAFFAVVGIWLSTLVPDKAVPVAFRNDFVVSKVRRILIGGIVTGLFLRLFGASIAVTNMNLFIGFAFGVGFLNFHLTTVLINVSTGIVGSTVASFKKKNSVTESDVDGDIK